MHIVIWESKSGLTSLLITPLFNQIPVIVRGVRHHRLSLCHRYAFRSTLGSESQLMPTSDWQRLCRGFCYLHASEQTGDGKCGSTVSIAANPGDLSLLLSQLEKVHWLK